MECLWCLQRNGKAFGVACNSHQAVFYLYLLVNGGLAHSYLPDIGIFAKPETFCFCQKKKPLVLLLI